MHAVGEWLRRHGEAIYGTQAGPIQGLDGVRTTRRGQTVYLTAFDWPGDDMPRAFELRALA